MSYYTPYQNLGLWDIIEALQNQAEQQQQQQAARQPQRAPQARSAPQSVASKPAQKETATVAKPVASSFVIKPLGRADVFLPPIDVYDTEKAYKIYISVPGALKSSIEVHFNPENNELTVEGEVPPPAGIKSESSKPSSSGKKESTPQLLLSERDTGAFARTLHLPSDPKIDDEKICAKFNAGLLEVTVPKKSGETAVRRKITIEDVDDEELLAEAQAKQPLE